jgi:hemoglobin-like flavoprotein
MVLNVELLEDSFVQVKSDSTEFTQRFYTTLFADYPEVQSLFASTDMEVQGKKLFQSLTVVIHHLRQPDVLSSALRGLGTQHLQYGVLPQHYPMVGNSLLKAFAATLGTAWTPDIQQAWAEAYEVVAQLMLEGAAYSAETLSLPNSMN